jgi:flavorubredoxin
MSKVELKEGIYWVGAIDWDIRDFHGYTTHRGTTYNAYLIVSDKIAVVDTVKDGFFPEMLERIKEIVDPKDIDYLVANHVEMDHSGSINAFLEAAPKAVIHCTKRCRDGLLSHFDIDREFVEVKTGDELSLGGKTLMFVEAPMLHWPDSMFTYVKEDRVLLPNDGFGQHLASEERFNDTVDQDVLYEEASKYYANILMPLGSLITKKLGELKDVPVDVIGPSHGVIWRDNPAQIVEQYAKWAAGESDAKKALVIYDTMWHSTEKMAFALVDALVEAGFDARSYHLRNDDNSDIIKEVLDARAVLIGSPTLNNKMFPTVAGFLNYLTGLRPTGKIAAAFGSYGWGGGAIKEINAALESTFDVVGPGVGAKFRPDSDVISKCRELVNEISKRIGD